MRFAKDKKLTDFDERKDKDDTPKKEWAPAKTTNTPVTKRTRSNSKYYLHIIISV